MTNEEKEWIKSQHSFGTVTPDDFPGLEEDIPFVAVPNMPLPDGSSRSFSVDEVLEVLCHE